MRNLNKIVDKREIRRYQHLLGVYFLLWRKVDKIEQN